MYTKARSIIFYKSLENTHILVYIIATIIINIPPYVSPYDMTSYISLTHRCARLLYCDRQKATLYCLI